MLLVFVIVPQSTAVPTVVKARDIVDKPLYTTPSEDIESKKMLHMHYQNARESVPEDYPIKPIGCCPYSKPLSKDLPLPDMLVPVLVNSPDMRLI